MKSLLALTTIFMLGATLHGTQQTLTVETGHDEDALQTVATA